MVVVERVASRTAQRPERIDLEQVAGRLHPFQQRHRTRHRTREEGPFRDVPDRPSVGIELVPLISGAGRERLEGGGRGHRIVGYVHCRPVAPRVSELRIEANHRDLLVERRSRQTEDLVEHVRQGHQRRADVEDEPVALEHGELAADGVIAFDDRDLVARDLEADGSGQAADTAADDHDAGHADLLASCVAGGGSDREHAEATDDGDERITEIAGETEGLHDRHVPVLPDESNIVAVGPRFDRPGGRLRTAP